MKTHRTLKGKIDLNGMKVEIESKSAPDFANLLRLIAGAPKASTKRAEKEADEDEEDDGSEEPAAASSFRTSKLKRNPVFSSIFGKDETRTERKAKRMRRKQNGWHKWEESDIIGIADLALRHGSNPSGFGRKAVDWMNEHGVFKGRKANTVRIVTDRIFSFVHNGDAKHLNPDTVRTLKLHGYGSNRQEARPVTNTPELA